MNHPLPKRQREAAMNDDPENGAIAPPSWLAQHGVSDDSEYLVDQYRQNKEQPVATHPSNSEAYEQYRQRVMDRQREQREFQTTRTVMPPIPSRPTMPLDDLRAHDRGFPPGPIAIPLRCLHPVASKPEAPPRTSGAAPHSPLLRSASPARGATTRGRPSTRHRCSRAPRASSPRRPIAPRRRSAR